MGKNSKNSQVVLDKILNRDLSTLERFEEERRKNRERIAEIERILDQDLSDWQKNPEKALSNEETDRLEFELEGRKEDLRYLNATIGELKAEERAAKDKAAVTDSAVTALGKKDTSGKKRKK